MSHHSGQKLSSYQMLLTRRKQDKIVKLSIIRFSALLGYIDCLALYYSVDWI